MTTLPVACESPVVELTPEAFLRALHGEDAQGDVVVWTLEDQRSQWFPATDLAAAGRAVAELAEVSNVYVGVALQDKAAALAEAEKRELNSAKLQGREPRPIRQEYVRGYAHTAVTIPGLWYEVDIGGADNAGAHQKGRLAPTLEDALALIREFPLTPSLIVFSGHGIQVWWLFPEPWVFESAEEREEAQDLAYRLEQTIHARARSRGWDTDSIHDLARVLRPPGSVNRKLEPVRVHVISVDERRRYGRDDFEPYLLDVSWARQDGHSAADLPENLPAIEVDSLHVSTWAKGLIRRGREAEPDRYQSRSEVIWRVIHDLIDADYADPTIASVLLDKRYQISEKARDKGSGARAWVAKQIGKARHEHEAQARFSFSRNGHDLDALPTGERPTSEATEPRPFPTTDLGNSERLVDQHGGEIRYCHIWGKWLFWDGRHWVVDDIGRIVTLAKQTVRSIYREAADADTAEQRRNLAAWARRSESEYRINAMIALARSAVPISPSELDREPWLLNVSNGTIELRTGELRPHRREDFITKLLDVEYEPGAECPLWERFLERIMDGNERLIRFLQRGAGYSATGSARERCVLIPWGSGKNGKGTLLQTLRALLGGYAVRAPSSAFLAKRGDTIPNDIAQLSGARFVFASETGDGRRLDESTIKDLTGGEDISARFMRGEWFSFRPTFTPWLATNHRPIIRGTDEAIWARIKLIPFTGRIPEEEQDLDLLEKLKGELPGILAWVVRGAAEWYQQGLDTPDEVRKATSEYRAHLDVLAAFLDERCEIAVDAQVTSKALYAAYREWCVANGEQPESQKALGLLLIERGYRKARGRGGARLWLGLALTTPRGTANGPRRG